MCIENETLSELEKEKEKIMQAVEIIKEFGPDIKAIRVIIENNKEKIENEIKNREKEDCEIKTNYLKRFDKIEQMVKGTNKILLSLYFTIITMFLGSTVFILLNAIYKWIIF